MDAGEDLLKDILEGEISRREALVRFATIKEFSALTVETERQIEIELESEIDFPNDLVGFFRLLSSRLSTLIPAPTAEEVESSSAERMLISPQARIWIAARYTDNGWEVVISHDNRPSGAGFHSESLEAATRQTADRVLGLNLGKSFIAELPSYIDPPAQELAEFAFRFHDQFPLHGFEGLDVEQEINHRFDATNGHWGVSVSLEETDGVQSWSIFHYTEREDVANFTVVPLGKLLGHVQKGIEFLEEGILVSEAQL